MSLTTANEPDRLNLTLVSRNFWPQSGAAELAAIDLASELSRQGHQIEVVTARWNRNWPSSFQIRGIPVNRIVRPGQGPWGSFRFQRQLSRTISQRSKLDGIIVFGFGDETLGSVRALRQIPLVIRVDYRNTPYSNWSQLRHRKTFSSLNRATAIVADSCLSAARLESHGLDPKRIHVIPDGMDPDVDYQRSTTEQVNSRMSISNAHPILSIDPGQPLVVCGAPLDNDGGVVDLIDAWKYVREELPKAKLWLLGDGSHGSQIWNQICSQEQVYSVILPGYFDDLQPVFAAADLYVHPLRSARACSFLTRAMNHSLCPVAVESDFTNALVLKNTSGLITSAGNPKSLAEAILHGLNHRDLRRRLGNRARELVVQSLSIEEQAKKYVELLNQQPLTIARSLP